MSRSIPSTEQIERGTIVGTARHQADKIGDLGPSQSKTPSEKLATDIEAAIAECWLVEDVFHEEWNPISAKQAVDHTDASGRQHEIKQTPVSGGSIIVRHRVPAHQIHHLVIGTAETGYTWAGFIDGIDIPLLGTWEDRTGDGLAWWVKRVRLIQPRAEGEYADEDNLDQAERVVKMMRRVGDDGLKIRPGLAGAARMYRREIAILTGK